MFPLISDNEKFNAQVKPNSGFLADLQNKLPEFFDREGNFDLDRFTAQLAEQNVNELSDGYQLNFIGKDYARRQAGEMPSTVIVPDEKQNNGEGKNSKNLFFTGDNLEVLRHLQANYTGKIDVIYIDPPYNTGNGDFVYPDAFEYSDEKLKEMFGMDDTQVGHLKSIQGKSSHSAWLTFMYPRLVLAKQLLTEDGAVFISIDENEHDRLKIICDEIFGAINYQADFIWKSTAGSNTGSAIKNVTEYVVCYSKNQHFFNPSGIKPLNDDQYKEEDEFVNTRGKFLLNKLDRRMTPQHYSESLNYSLRMPDDSYIYPGGGEKQNNWNWRWSKSKVQWGIKNKFIVVKKGKKGWSVYFKQYKKVDNNDKPINRVLPQQNLLNIDGVSSSRGTAEVTSLFNNQKVFDYPKPINLIKFIIKIIRKQDAVILDFFAGSSTTANAVMQLNAEDGGNRKFIMVQLPEKTYKTYDDGTPKLDKDGNYIPTKGGKAAYEAGFRSIDEISRERIRRSAAKIREENELTLPADFDGSFKHYRVVEPTKQALEDIEDFDPDNTALFTNMVDSFSSQGLAVAGEATGEQTILTTWLAKDGYPFDAKVQRVDFAGYQAALVEDSRLYIINDGWSSANTEALLNQLGTYQLTVQTIVLFGYSFNIADLRELEIGVKQLDGNINLLKRY